METRLPRTRRECARAPCSKSTTTSFHSAAAVRLPITTQPIASSPLTRHPGRWYFVAGYEQDFVAHDAFIEGEGGAPGAVRLPWVGEGFAATGINLRRFAMEYRYVVRGREYQTEPDAHAYGSIVINTLFD